MQHPTALVQSDRIGLRTRIWAFVNILPGAVVGSDCNICDRVFIEGRVVIGDRVTVKCGVSLWDGITVEDDVFIGPGATFANDPFPRSKSYPEQPVRTLIRRNASIGANATILAGLTVGVNAMVGAGAVVTKNVPSNAIVYGNPGRIHGYVSTDREPGERTSSSVGSTPSVLNKLKGVRIIEMPTVQDMRGVLTFGQVHSELPFVPMRYFMVHDVPSKDVRGEHAHRTLQQLLICVKGSCRVVLDDGTHRAEVKLDSPHRALYLPPMIWGIQYGFSAEATLMVLASEVYSADDYIRDYDEFLRVVSTSRQ